MTSINSLNILQWNARSANANKLDLTNLLKTNDIHISILSETCFRPGKVYKFNGFNMVHVDRDGGKGGVAVLVAAHIQYKNITFDNTNLPNLAEICGIEVIINKEPITIISLYRPPKMSIAVNEWENFFNKFNGNTIIGGDFNAHHSMWGSGKTDTDGNVLVDALSNSNLVVINNGSATRMTPPGITKSAVDITLVSPSLATIAEWKTIDDCMGSDRFPILIRSN